jgi:RimJ/RimL family protein N-acetyltransferase
MNLTDNLFAGKLIRLAAPNPTDHPIMAKWTENVEYWRMLDTDPAQPRDVDFWVDDDKERKDDGRTFSFRIRTLTDDKLIGFLGLRVTWSNQVCMLAIAIGEPEYWGRGYGSDALRVGIDYAFRELGLYKVSLSVFSYNTRAIRAYEKVGFVHEARQRAMAYRDGEHFDWVEMGILRPEWEARLTESANA